MVNPYKIEPPFVINYSGGRTSGYLLYHILDAYQGDLPDEDACQIVFTNTGKEFPATLDHVHAVEDNWNVPIAWIEWRKPPVRFKIVDYTSAARNGEPFDELIRHKNYLPNTQTRTYTQHLKIEACAKYIRWVWPVQEYTGLTGIRYDEPSRWKSRGQDPRNPYRWVSMPLIEAKVTVDDVMAFWSRQSFDLALKPHESNCDLCFLKANAKRVQIIRDHPETAAWWLAKEAWIRSRGYNGGFRPPDRKDYSRLHAESLVQLASAACPTPLDLIDELDECACTD